VADAVVIGSRIIEEIEKSPRELAAANVAAFLKEIRIALDRIEGAPR
jgi:tryptophan synthase alpha chain